MIAIYARQSLDKKDSISIETQIDFCKHEIYGDEEYKVYKDKGFSGKNISRPAFTELINDIEAGKISRLIVYRLDRISRSISDFAGIIDLLEKYNVTFTSANEKFDTSAPVGRAMLYIIIVFAQMERETLAERIRDNYYARGKTGVWLGGPAPLGFNNVKTNVGGRTASTLIPNKDIDIIKEVFELYSGTNMSLGAIAKIMREKYNTMFNNIKLARILHNPAYVKADVDIYAYYKSKRCIIVNEIEEFTGEKGCNMYGKRDRASNKYNLTENHVLSLSIHEGVIDSQTFLDCQNKLAGNKQIKNTGKGKHTWLTGLVKCGYCGYTMNVKLYNGTRYFYCRGRGISDMCLDKLPTYYVADIEDAVFQQILETIDRLKSQEPGEEPQQAENTDTNKLKMELYNIEEEIRKLIETLSSANDIVIEYVNKKVTELDRRKTELSQAILVQRPTKPLKIPMISNIGEIGPETKKEIALSLIDAVKVYADSIEVVWKY